MLKTSARTPGRGEQNQQSETLYTLSEVGSQALSKVAGLAPSLKEAELRVLLHLTGKALAAGSLSVAASSREIAESTKCGRRNVVRALDALSDRGFLATRQGTATRSAAHMLRFLEVARMGGVAMTPPPQASGVGMTPPLVSLQHQGGDFTTPPPTENEGLAETDPPLDRCTTPIETIDRVLSAQTHGKPRDELQHWAAIVDTYSERLGRKYSRPPDSTVCAQLIEACEGRRETLYWLIQEIHRERKQPGETPAWWVTVALQRIHGIGWKTTATRRQELRSSRRPRLERIPAPERETSETPPGNSGTPSQEDVQALNQAIAAAAEGMKLK